MSYILNNDLIIRNIDKALFNYKNAELVEFNDDGFEILSDVLKSNYDETDIIVRNFIDELLDCNILIEVDNC